MHAATIQRERRSSPRQMLGAAAVLIPEDHPSHASLDIVVRNFNLGGVGFCSPVPFPRGARYRLRIGSGPLHLSSSVRIVSSRQRPDGNYDVGGVFH